MTRAHGDSLDFGATSGRRVVRRVDNAETVHELLQWVCRVFFSRIDRDAGAADRLRRALAVEEEDGRVGGAVVRAFRQHHVCKELGRVVRQRGREALAQRTALVDVELCKEHDFGHTGGGALGRAHQAVVKQLFCASSSGRTQDCQSPHLHHYQVAFSCGTGIPTRGL